MIAHRKSLLDYCDVIWELEDGQLKGIKKMKCDYRKILIFGGNGFLGSHVVDELVSKKFKVTIFDKMIGAGEIKKQNLLKEIFQIQGYWKVK